MKFALVGHPVSHSLSPAIHAAAYRELGQEHEYALIDAPAQADVARVFERLRAGELAGANVTVPWKRRAFELCDARSELAEQLGVVNVLVPQGGGVVGHNTDALALLEEFRRLVRSSRAVVLGSGGAAPAVVAACRGAGIAEIFVTARRFDPASPESSWPGAAALQQLGARALPWPAFGAEARARFDAAARGAGLVVQCTSAGMQGADSGEPLARLVTWSELAADALAYDLIYAPLETPFLRAAREAGLRAAHGLHMLVGQARLAVELWLGAKPPAEPLLRAAQDALAGRRA